jgi:hypothetical protein
LDSDGIIKKIIVLSGQPLLAEAAKENVKKWRFTRGQDSRDNGSTSPAEDLELIYEFNLRNELAASPKSEFVFDYPNHVTITASAPRMNP